MADKCVSCGKRRGTRHCPALGGYICSRCCGEKRLVEISCPRTCPHLERHEAFQEQKSKDRYREAWLQANADIKYDQNALSILFSVERAIKHAADVLPGLTDADVVTGLADVDRRLSPIELIDQPASRCGNVMWEFLSTLARERSVPTTQLRDGVQRMKQLCTELSDPHVPRAFLHGLLGWLRELSGGDEKRSSAFIITPNNIR